VAELADALA